MFLGIRSDPDFEPGELVIIADPKAARYLLIKKRKWEKRRGGKEWVYHGAVFIVTGGILVFFSQGAFTGVELIRVRGLE